MLVDVVVQILQPHIFLFLFAGVVYFIIIGVIPIMGGPIGIAMLIPLLIFLDPVYVFALVIGGHAAVGIAGALTSIVLGIPGTTQDVAQIFDGHPLAKKGMAGKAIGAVAMSSIISVIIGFVIFMSLIPFLHLIVLALGPGEVFMILLWGLLAFSALRGKEPFRALAAGFFGMLLSCVGLDTANSFPRYTLGLLELWEGIPIIIALVGVFGIGQLLSYMVEGEKAIAIGKVQKATTGLMEGMKDTIKHLWLALRASIIGLVIGAVPGIGGATSTMVAYAHAVSTSKKQEEFGKGRIEGVVAPQATLPAKDFGALIPTISFGIPGSEYMALFLGVLMMKGLTPGYKLLTENLDMVYLMGVLQLFGVVLGVLFTVMWAPVLIKITKVRLSLLIPFIMLILMLGVYSVRHMFLDVVLMFLFGLLGYTLKKYGFSQATFVIGFVLGGFIEYNFLLSTRLYGLSFLTRPIVLALLAMMITPFLPSIIKKLRVKRS
jgi:TctA family transporter